MRILESNTNQAGDHMTIHRDRMEPSTVKQKIDAGSAGISSSYNHQHRQHLPRPDQRHKTTKSCLHPLPPLRGLVLH